jgi:hypothetical protein
MLRADSKMQTIIETLIEDINLFNEQEEIERVKQIKQTHNFVAFRAQMEAKLKH